MATLNADEAKTRLQGLSGWKLEGSAIRRTFTFPGFKEALAYVVELGEVAEAADHHPDILITYKRVTLTYSTHSAGGLTEKDFAGAAAADAIAKKGAAD